MRRLAIIFLLFLPTLATPASAEQKDSCPGKPQNGTEACSEQIGLADQAAAVLLRQSQSSLIKDAKKSIKKLSRDIVMFHWANAEYVGLKPGERVKPDDPRLKDYIRKQVSNFWDSPFKGGEMGNGLYTAMDPGTSSAFGGDDKAVVEITMPKGTKFLDIRYPVAPLSAETQQALAKAGCPNKDLPSVFLENRDGYREACYAIAKPLLKELGVPMVAQKWGWAQPMDCGSKPGVAFMLVDSAAAEKKHGARIFTSSSDPDGNDADELRNIEQGVLEWALPTDTMFANKMLLPNSADLKYRWGPITQFNARKDYLKWMKKHLFSCGDYKEDAMPPDTPGIKPVTPADRNAADLMDRYLVDLALLKEIADRNHTKIDPSKFRSVSLGFMPLGPINSRLLQSWNSPGQKFTDSPALQSLLSQINGKISEYKLNDNNHWAWLQGDSTNLVQLGLSAAQQYLKISPPPFTGGNDQVARDLMAYVWKSFGQPAVPAGELQGDIIQLNVQDYSSGLGKDLWLGPYREGVNRVEACIKKYDKNLSKALRDKDCGPAY